MGSEKTDSISVIIYTHPEFFPPVLNAIDELSEVFDRVNVISRNLKTNDWVYPSNVRLIGSGEPISIGDSETAPTSWKIRSFLRFTSDLHKNLKKEKPRWVMCNDPISLLAVRMIRFSLGYPVKIWYHNHDVAEMKTMRKYSVGYFALKNERKYFSEIDLFTLPTEERLKYFPVDRLKGKWLVVPNYPSIRRRVKSSRKDWQPGMDLKMIYQGRISAEHGLEEMIDCMKSISGLHLTIIGPGEENYMDDLEERIENSGAADRIRLMKAVAYSKLAEITETHHVGWAVNKPVNILYSTAALASNKIYEYAAAGLPVFYYNDPHYSKSLSSFKWAFATDLRLNNIAGQLSLIENNYSLLSVAAEEDFKEKLNFGIVFRPVLNTIKKANS